MQVEVHFVSELLRGNDTTEMSVTLIRYIEDEMHPDEERALAETLATAYHADTR